MNACTEKLYPFNPSSSEQAIVVRMTMAEAASLLRLLTCIACDCPPRDLDPSEEALREALKRVTA